MMVSGIVVTTIGCLSAIAGAVLIGIDQANKEADLYGFATGIGAIVLVLGSVHLGVGIPLWVVGSGPPEVKRVSSWAVPTIAAGPRSVRLRWTF
jgi:hypothetical protein